MAKVYAGLYRNNTEVWIKSHAITIKCCNIIFVRDLNFDKSYMTKSNQKPLGPLWAGAFSVNPITQGCA